MAEAGAVAETGIEPVATESCIGGSDGGDAGESKRGFEITARGAPPVESGLKRGRKQKAMIRDVRELKKCPAQRVRYASERRRRKKGEKEDQRKYGGAWARDLRAETSATSRNYGGGA